MMYSRVAVVVVAALAAAAFVVALRSGAARDACGARTSDGRCPVSSSGSTPEEASQGLSNEAAARRTSDAESNTGEQQDFATDDGNRTSGALEINSYCFPSPRNPERRGNKYGFAFKPYRSVLNRTEPIVAQGPVPWQHYLPSVLTRTPQFTSDAEAAEYRSRAAERHVIRGVYRQPYHPSTCDVTLDPCETLSNASSLVLADFDLDRPPIALQHCNALPISPDGPCSPRNRGHSILFRHRHLHRWNCVDAHEFDPDPIRYIDIGRYSGPRSRTQLYSRDLYSSIPSDCNMTETPGLRMLVSRPLGVGYGLTNRILSYAGTMSLSMRVGRHMALEKGAQRFPITALINFSSSVLPSQFRYVKRCHEVPSVDVRKKIAGKTKQGYKQIDRQEVARRPHRALAQLETRFQAIRKIPAALFHEMYQRYPYEQDQRLQGNIGTIMCGLQFVSWIQSAAQTCIRRAREMAWSSSGHTTRKYAALHLRMELSDAFAMLRGRRSPSVDQVVAFLTETVIPMMQQRGMQLLVVCSGPLDPRLWRAMVQCGAALNTTVISKAQLLTQNDKVAFKDFGTSSSDGGAKVTSTDAAAADLLVLEKADIVFLTTTSSFSAFVYARRCGGSVHLGASITWNLTRTQLRLPNDAESEAFPGRIFDNYGSGCTLVGNVFLYDVYLDGTFTGVVEYPCGYQFGDYITAPPALVPRPPLRLNVITFRFMPNSALFTNKSRNADPRLKQKL